MNGRARLVDPIRAALAAQWPRPDCDTVVIDLPLPISTNDLHASSFATVRRSERYRTWARAAGTMLNAQRPGSVRGPYAITLLVNPRRSRVDLDNTIKGISDLLQEHRIIENDRMAQRVTLEWSDAIPGSRVFVERWRKESVA